MDGANIDQCQSLLEEIYSARAFDEEIKHQSVLDDFEAKVREYQPRLSERTNV